jgi:two-component system chemotaxis response regulator CheB
VAIVASAGGLSAIRDVLAALPRNFPVPIVVVQHLAPEFPSRLPKILARCTSLDVCPAADGAMLCPATVYVATPGLHVTIRDAGTLRLTASPTVHYARPSADTLLHSVAEQFAARAIAVILSGSGCDGARGAQAVEHAGGRVIAQDRETSQYFSMPHAAAHATQWPLVLPLARIAPALVRMAAEGVTS